MRLNFLFGTILMTALSAQLFAETPKEQALALIAKSEKKARENWGWHFSEDKAVGFVHDEMRSLPKETTWNPEFIKTMEEYAWPLARHYFWPESNVSRNTGRANICYEFLNYWSDDEYIKAEALRRMQLHESIRQTLRDTPAVCGHKLTETSETNDKLKAEYLNALELDKKRQQVGEKKEEEKKEEGKFIWAS